MFLESEPANVLAHTRHHARVPSDKAQVLSLVLRIAEQSSASESSAQTSPMLPEITRYTPTAVSSTLARPAILARVRPLERPLRLDAKNA